MIDFIDIPMNRTAKAKIHYSRFPAAFP